MMEAVVLNLHLFMYNTYKAFATLGINAFGVVQYTASPCVSVVHND